jgi:hypothetical protein
VLPRGDRQRHLGSTFNEVASSFSLKIEASGTSAPLFRYEPDLLQGAIRERLVLTNNFYSEHDDDRSATMVSLRIMRSSSTLPVSNSNSTVVEKVCAFATSSTRGSSLQIYAMKTVSHALGHWPSSYTSQCMMDMISRDDGSWAIISNISRHSAP